MPLNFAERYTGGQLEALRQHSLDLVDIAAGEARARFVSDGKFVTEEYRQTAERVREWRAAGSPADAVPQEILVGAYYEEQTTDGSATNIDQTAALYAEGILWCRMIRLFYKRALLDASGATEIRQAVRSAEAACDLTTIVGVASVLAGAAVPTQIADILAQVRAAVAST